jgi:adenosine deaminase
MAAKAPGKSPKQQLAPGKRGMTTAVAERPREQRMSLRRFAAIISGAAALIFLLAAIVLALNWDATVTAAAFNGARGNQTALRNLIYRMPKGADLHVHLTGGIFAERYIAWAVADRLCVQLSDGAIVNPPIDKDKKRLPCETGTAPIEDVVGQVDTPAKQQMFDRIVNALSMRDYQPTPAEPSGHDHFFATFGRFAAAAGPHFTDMVAELLKIYDDQSAQYVELMTSFSGYDERKPLVGAIGEETDFQKMLDKLNAAGLAEFVVKKKAELAKAIADIEKLRNCAAAATQPGCAVRYNFIAQVSRNGAIADVFVQTALAAALIRAEPRIVGLNFVQAEDNVIALRDYRRHMEVVRFLAKDVPVSLHAGELWLGLVPPADLTFHIGDAVTVAGARRIGHGVSLAFERDLDNTLAVMRQRPVAVEINLTSNDQILGVRGAQHPFPAYIAAGVPVVLSTDDAAVERIDLTNEYVRAARDYRLGYGALRSIARASLAYSFLEDGAKRAELTKFDHATAAFESAVAARNTFLANLELLIKAAVRW